MIKLLELNQKIIKKIKLITESTRQLIQLLFSQ